MCGPVYGTLAIIVWLGFLASDVHPTLAGVAIALLVPMYRPNRRDVEHALDLARTFRQSPKTEYARAAANSFRESISINERLQSACAPYGGYVILPLFALANAGVLINEEILAAAARSPIMWGILVGLVVGNFIGILGATALMRVFKVGDFGAGLTLDRIAGGGALCGIGFTISLFIIDLAIDEPTAQNEARVGVLAASVIAFLLATVIFRNSDAVRPTQETGRTLARAVDPARDDLFGPVDAPLTIVEYGNSSASFASRHRTPSKRSTGRSETGCLRLAARAAHCLPPERPRGRRGLRGAALQGKFFEMEKSLFADQENQRPSDIIRRAQELGLDVPRFEADLTTQGRCSRA